MLKNEKKEKGGVVAASRQAVRTASGKPLTERRIRKRS
jgi:hypothetical protein